MARFYVLTGKWAGNGLSNEFIIWFKLLIRKMRCLSFDLCRGSLSSTRSATFDACFKLLIRMLSIAKTLILESRILSTHLQSCRN